MAGVILLGRKFDDLDLTGKADLAGASLTGLRVPGSRDGQDKLRAADANLSGAQLVGADLRCADLTGAKLRGAAMRSANLSGADLTNAEACGLDARRAQLHDAIVRGADLRDADLRYARGLQLDGCKIAGLLLDARTDEPWTRLKRAYTGTRFAVLLAMSVAAIAMIFGKGLLLSSDLLLPALQGLAAGGACPAAACAEISLLSLMTGWHKATSAERLLLIATIFFQLSRLALTLRVSVLRELEEESGGVSPYQWPIKETANDSLLTWVQRLPAAYGPLSWLAGFSQIVGLIVLVTFILAIYDLSRITLQIPIP